MDAETFFKSFAAITDAPGGVEVLRGLVLNLAIKGQLVEQNSTEEPVASLLRRVGAARSGTLPTEDGQALRSAAPIEAKEGPWLIPAGWVWVRLDELALPQAGFAFRSKQFNQTGLGTPLIRIRDIGNDATECHYEGDFRPEFLVEQGDYLIGMDGNFNIRRWAGPRALLNQRVTRLLFYSDELERSFVTWALQNRINALHGTRAIRQFSTYPANRSLHRTFPCRRWKSSTESLPRRISY